MTPDARFQLSNETMALAISFMRSKPSGQTMRGFVLNMRKHVLQESERPGEGESNLIASSFWKDLFERSQRRCVRLQTENARLQRKLDATNPAEITLPASKRKESPTADLTRIGAKKRARTEYGSPWTSTDLCTGEAILDDIDTLDMCRREHEALLLHVYHLYRLYRQALPNVRHLSYYLIEGASSLSSFVDYFWHNCDETSHLSSSSANVERRERLDAGNFLRITARTFTSLKYGLALLSRIHHEADTRGAVIYSFIRLFDSFVGCVADMTKSEVGGSSRTRGSARSRSASQKARGNNDEAMLGQVLQLLRAMVSDLDPSDAWQREVFEGLLVAVQQRAAERLYVYTFGHTRHDTIEQDIECTRNIDQTGSLIAARQNPLEKTKVSNLTAVLELVMMLAPNHLKDVQLQKEPKGAAKAGKKAGGRAARSVGKVALNQLARERVQQTLLNAVFGEERTDCLQLPKISTIPVPAPAMDEEDVEERFKMDMWRLFGWEILGQEQE